MVEKLTTNSIRWRYFFPLFLDEHINITNDFAIEITRRDHRATLPSKAFRSWLCAHTKHRWTFKFTFGTRRDKLKRWTDGLGAPNKSCSNAQLDWITKQRRKSTPHSSRFGFIGVHFSTYINNLNNPTYHSLRSF